VWAVASTVPDVRQGLDWIPDHQLHVLETLGHANELIAEVLTCLDGYFAEGDGPFEVRDEYSGPLCNATITAIRPIPSAVAMYAADAMVALRAAIEHVLYEPPRVPWRR
jgi:hypothetical protein